MHLSALFPLSYLSRTGADIASFAIVGIVTGAGWIAHAFQAEREETEITDTPISRCDAAAVGTVAVSGIAHADQLYSALFSGSACIFCRCKIFKWISAGKYSSWKDIATILYPPHPFFTLTDDSGNIAVLADNAELRLAPTRYECGRSGGLSLLALEQGGDLIEPSGRDILESYGSLDNNRYRIEEITVTADTQLYVYGTATEAAMRPNDIVPNADALPKNQLIVWKGTGKSDFLITNQAPQDIASEMMGSVTLGMIGGPLIIAFSVAALAWLSLTP